jgi:hypothetical protein
VTEFDQPFQSLKPSTKEFALAVLCMAYDSQGFRRRMPDGPPLDFEDAWSLFMSHEGEVSRIINSRATRHRMTAAAVKAAVREIFNMIVQEGGDTIKKTAR